MTTPSKEAAARVPWAYGVAILASLVVFVALAGCDTPPPAAARYLSTATAAAKATVSAASQSGATSLPTLSADPGWVAVVHGADGLQLGGPQVIGGGGTVTTTVTNTMTMTLGTFTLSHDTRVVVLFSCVGRAGEHSSVTLSVSDAFSFTSRCAESAGPQQRDQMQLLTAWAGRTMTVTATITTDGSSPQWNALVEQPK
ncbi:MAG TPA: hypothetical protein VF792_11040 [Ktedonobacterales bacterium]